ELAQPSHLHRAAARQLDDVDAGVTEPPRPIAARREREHDRREARPVEAPNELVELILGAALPELADDVGDARGMRCHVRRASNRMRGGATGLTRRVAPCPA